MRYSYPRQISGKEVCASRTHHSCCVTIQTIHMALLPCPKWIKHTIIPAAALLFETGLQFPWWHAYASLKFILNIHASKSQEPNIQRKQKVHKHSQTKAFQETETFHQNTSLCMPRLRCKGEKPPANSFHGCTEKWSRWQSRENGIIFLWDPLWVSKGPLTKTISEHLLA